MSENYCPACGSKLPAPDIDCPTCAEARKLVLQLASDEPVRLCSQCGKLLEEDEEGNLCSTCAKVKPGSVMATFRQQGRVTRWLQEQVEKQPAAAQIPCPHCQEPILVTAIFCSSCGNKVVGEQAPAYAAPMSRGEEEPLLGDEAQEGIVSTGFSEVERDGIPTAEPDLSAEEGRSFAQRVSDQAKRSFQELFPPTEEQEGTEGSIPIWQQVLGGLRALLPHRRPTLNQTLVWILVLLLVGIAGLVYLWIWMLGSGQVVLR